MFDFNPLNGLILFQALQMENEHKRAPRAKRESFLSGLFQRKPKTSLPLTGTPGRGAAASRTTTRSIPATAVHQRSAEREVVLSIR